MAWTLLIWHCVSFSPGKSWILIFIFLPFFSGNSTIIQILGLLDQSSGFPLSSFLFSISLTFYSTLPSNLSVDFSFLRGSLFSGVPCLKKKKHSIWLHGCDIFFDSLEIWIIVRFFPAWVVSVNLVCLPWTLSFGGWRLSSDFLVVCTPVRIGPN